MIVATEDEASTCRAEVSGGSVTINYDYFLVNRDLVEALNRLTIVDEFPSAPLNPLKLVFRAEKKDVNKLVQHVPLKTAWMKWRQSQGESCLEKGKEESVSLSLLATIPKGEKTKINRES